MYVVNGIIFGLILAVLIGPVFFTLIQTSIEKGFKKALLVAIGISISDIFYVLLAYYGVSKFIQSSGYDQTIGYIGGCIMIVFGLVSFVRSRKKVALDRSVVEAKGFFRHIFKGFLINGLSPFVLVFWIGAMSLATVEYDYQDTELVYFFTAIIVVVFMTDLLKAYLAGKLRVIMTPRLFKILNIVVGIMLCAFGVKMFTYSF